MAVLGNVITPGISDLRHVEAQGANTGDYAYGTDGGYYRWNGERWERESGGTSIPGQTQMPESPFTTEWWTKARQEAFSSLTPYYEQKLRDAKGDVDLAKRLIEEDYRIGNRYRTEDLEIEKGDVERAKQRLADDFSRTEGYRGQDVTRERGITERGISREEEDFMRGERIRLEDLASELATFGRESAEERRNIIAQTNLRGTLFGEIPTYGQIDQTRAPYSQYAKEYVLSPMEEKQALRRQAIERAIQRQSEVAGIGKERNIQDIRSDFERYQTGLLREGEKAGLEKTRGTEDVASQFRRFQLGQTKGEEEAKLGREKELSQSEITLRKEQDRLKREQEERAYGQIVPRRYESEYAAWRASNRLP